MSLEKTQERSAKIKNTKIKNNIKRMREQAEQFLHHITEIDKHFNNKNYYSMVFYKQYLDAVEKGKLPEYGEVGCRNVPISGADISNEYITAFKNLEEVVKESVAKIPH